MRLFYVPKKGHRDSKEIKMTKICWFLVDLIFFIVYNGNTNKVPQKLFNYFLKNKKLVNLAGVKSYNAHPLTPTYNFVKNIRGNLYEVY